MKPKTRPDPELEAEQAEPAPDDEQGAGEPEGATGDLSDTETVERPGGEPEGGTDEGEGIGEGEPNVSPEEQQAYDTVVTAAMAQIWGSEVTHKAIVEKLRAAPGEKLAPEIGHTGAMILTSIDGAAEKQGREIPDEIVLQAGQEIVAELVDLAIAAGFAEEGQRDELYKVAMLEGTKAYGEARINASRVTPEEMKQRSDEFRQMRGDAGGEGGEPAPEQPGPKGPVAAAKEGGY